MVLPYLVQASLLLLAQVGNIDWLRVLAYCFVFSVHAHSERASIRSLERVSISWLCLRHLRAKSPS